MADIIDSGTNGFDLTVLAFPKFEQVGYVEEELGIQFYNPDAPDSASRAGGAQGDFVSELLPDIGYGIETIFKLPITPDVILSNKGFLLFSLNGSGNSNDFETGGLTGTNGFGSFSIGIADSTGRPVHLTTASGANAYKLFIAIGTSDLGASVSTAGTPFVEYYGSGLNDGLFHVVHVNLSYLASSYTGSVLSVDAEIFLDGVSIATKTFNIGYANISGRIEQKRINIGGFSFVSGQTPTGVIHSTASFPGIIDQVRIYDAPVSSTDIEDVATDYILPSA